MRYTKSAIGLLNNQYRSILKKCLMINLGIFAYTGMASAAYNLNDAVADTVTPREYILGADENVTATLGTMGAGQLTIDGNASNYGINASQEAPSAVGGITVGTGNTLILKNLGSVTVSGEGTAVTDYTVNSSVNGFVSAAGGFLNNSGTATISDVVFSNNTATGDGIGGGAIYNSGEITEISNAMFIGNNMSNGSIYGGAINNDYGTIGNISGKFVGNSLNAMYYAMGSAIQNIDGQIGNISADFIGNISASAQDSVFGGVIYNTGYYTSTTKIGNISGTFENNTATAAHAVGGSVIANVYAEMGNISADFIGNTASGDGATIDGLIYNASYYTLVARIGNITGDIKNNTLTGKTIIGLIANEPDNEYPDYTTASSIIGNISGEWSNNTLTGTNKVQGFIYNKSASSATAEIGNITADFKNNTLTAPTVYGGILNTGVINKIEGSTFENNTANGSGVAIGGAITNQGTITEGIINAKFLNNGVITNGAAQGAAIYTTKSLKIAADGSIGDGISTFQGNYSQVSGGDKKYEAIRVSGATNTLIFEAKNGGTINMYDYIDGDEGYTTTVTGDSTGTVNLYNDIKSSNVSIEKVDVSTADGTLHDYSLLSLKSDAAVKWKIDFDVKDAAADTFETAVPAAATDTEPAGTASAGTVTLDKLNLTNGDYSDISGADFKVQILKTQGDETAADLQLALSDELKAELGEGVVIDEKRDTVVDEVTANTKWSDEFREVGTITTTTAKLGLTTTDTLNDSIGVVSEETTEVTVDEKLGDTLAMVNQAELSDKTFTAAKDDDVYKAEDDLGATSGNVTIKGVSSGDKKSTVDLDGHNGFVIGEGASVALSDVKLTDGAGKAGVEIAEGGKLTMQNAALDKVDLKVNGELDAGTSKVAAKNAAFGKDSTLKLTVNNIKDDYGAFTADSFDIAQGAKLDVTFGQNPLGGEKTGEVALLALSDGSDIDNNNFADEFHNNMYKFSRKSEKSGVYGVYQTKTAEEISRENGGTKTNQGAAAAWVDGDSFADGIAAEIADSLAALAQNNGASFNEELTALAPNDDGMVQAMAADLTDRLMLTVDKHLYDSANEEGLASGDSRNKTRGYPDLSGVSTWVKGYYGKSKMQRRADIYGFDADSTGIIAGVDKKVTSSVKIGVGMQYDDSDIDAFHRDVEAKTTLGFAYAEYRPSKWFVNGVFGYGVTDYDEDKYAVGQKIAAHYKAEVYSLQGLTGYQFKYFTPEIGARYYMIKRHGYVDGALQDVSGKNMDLLRTTAGVKAHTTYGMFKPNAYFGITYDVVSDRDNALVSLGNGATYSVHGKRLPRFGVELGAGVAADVTNNLEVVLGYEAKFRKDYQDHSGIVTVKYKF